MIVCINFFKGYFLSIDMTRKILPYIQLELSKNKHGYAVWYCGMNKHGFGEPELFGGINFTYKKSIKGLTDMLKAVLLENEDKVCVLDNIDKTNIPHNAYECALAITQNHNARFK